MQSHGSLLSCTIQRLPGEAKCLLVSGRPLSPWLISLAPRQTGEIQVLPVPLLGFLYMNEFSSPPGKRHLSRLIEFLEEIFLRANKTVESFSLTRPQNTQSHFWPVIPSPNFRRTVESWTAASPHPPPSQSPPLPRVTLLHIPGLDINTPLNDLQYSTPL